MNLLFRTERDSTIYMCENVRIILPSVVFKNHLGPWFLNGDMRRSVGVPIATLTYLNCPVVDNIFMTVLAFTCRL